MRELLTVTLALLAVGSSEVRAEARLPTRRAARTTVRVTLAGRRTTIDLSRRFPDSAGAYLFKPGRRPRALSTPDDTAFLGDIVSATVGEFFDVQACRAKA
jgi:hypothetical protein